MIMGKGPWSFGKEHTMKTSDVRDLAIKLFGVYCLVSFVTLVPQVVMVLMASESAMQHVSSRLAVAALVSIQAAAFVAFAYLFLFRTAGVVRLIWGPSASSEQSCDGLQVATGLAFWIILIGVFYLIQSSSLLLPQLWRLVTQRGIAASYLWGELVSEALVLAASLFCILKSKDIEGFIQSRQHAVH
jgi:hypothetical protein